jgi:hypothetical protein
MVYHVGQDANADDVAVGGGGAIHQRFILQHLGEAVEIDSAPTGTNSGELAVCP